MSELRRIFDSSEVVFGKIMVPGYDVPLAPQSVVDQRQLLIKGMAGFLTQNFASQESLDITLETGFVASWSRTTGDIRIKGETSGNYQKVRGIYVDCDYDSILIDAEPFGPACHKGENSCFEQ